MFCVVKEITQNEKVTGGGGDGGSGLCESPLRAFKWFHYFLNPFWI